MLPFYFVKLFFSLKIHLLKIFFKNHFHHLIEHTLKYLFMQKKKRGKMKWSNVTRFYFVEPHYVHVAGNLNWWYILKIHESRVHALFTSGMPTLCADRTSQVASQRLCKINTYFGLLTTRRNSIGPILQRIAEQMSLFQNHTK